ncbi:MarR family transcriptional regulator [Caldanaerobacter subterraneus]|uniref:MarR family transcriptional regulator n=1 Tax=Caldanaerobacter subterraneus TaxID=911092 RepID=A0A7Y2L844_9THEO|nr:MarR family transcriptional regulator [Caldanaerobacter subterraneus]NNG66151.1 MarR family transcriptional regulator [Caldanaerobacter subterraneus]
MANQVQKEKQINRVHHNIPENYLAAPKKVLDLEPDEIGLYLIVGMRAKLNLENHFEYIFDHSSSKYAEIQKAFDGLIEKSKNIDWVKESNQKGKFSKFYIDKYPIFDRNLSLTAKGVLFYMLTKTEGWQFYITEMAKSLHTNTKTINKALDELEENGYLKREPIPGTKKYKFTIYEVPHNN